MNGLTNATSKDIAWCPKHQIVKTVLSVRRHYPKRGRFTENLSIYLSSPAPNSLLENPSNFGATAFHWLLYILLFFFFLILTGWMRGALCVATHLYILYPVGSFFLLIPKSPQLSPGCQFIHTLNTKNNLRSQRSYWPRNRLMIVHFASLHQNPSTEDSHITRSILLIQKNYYLTANWNFR